MFNKIKKKINEKKGVAGLDLLMNFVTMLFVVGILVMAFAIAGSKMYDTVDSSEAKDIINTTYTSIDDVVDWFPTFIVIMAVVVLVLLIVILIRAVRSTGMMGGGGA